MKKIMFISSANSIHTVKWVNALCKKYEVYLIFCSNHQPSIDNIDSRVHLFKLKFKSPFGYYLNAVELRKLFNMIKPDLVNVHYASGYGTLARFARLNPVLLSVWGSDIYEFPKKSSINRLILKKNLNYADAIASTSNIMSDQMKKLYPELSKPIYITPFGVDVKKFKRVSVNKHSNINIGIIKSLKKIYGIDYGILAIKELKDRFKANKNNELSNSIKFYIYGDGEEKSNLESLIKEKNLSDSVFLKGKISNSEVPMVMNGFDVFCATSINESFGVAVLEAMACELPVVATDADGFKEVMEDGKTGYIVAKKDITAIADALEKLISNRELAEQMGRNGRKRVLQLFNWEDNVENMVKIYEDLIK